MKKIKIGILGGGQLARMLAQKGLDLGYDIHIFAESEDSPAAKVCGNTFVGNLNSLEDLVSFCKAVDLVTFESEFLDTKLLQSALKNLSTKVSPSAKVIEKIQDRLTQKKLLKKYGILTADFKKVTNQDQLIKALNYFPQGVVLKKRRFGYDGYGNFIINQESDIKNLPKEIWEDPYGFIAEEKISFKRELAIILARNARGEIVCLPLIETKQKDSKCDWVMGPVKHKNLPFLIKKLKYFISSLNYQGVIAFELFDDGNKLKINEVAPRVHNSGHYSQEACVDSQFSYHLKAICNDRLPTLTLNSKGFAMTNLIGTNTDEPKWKLPNKAFFHWYGKKDNQKGRKMGHINAIAKTPALALKKALEARREISL